MRLGNRGMNIECGRKTYFAQGLGLLLEVEEKGEVEKEMGKKERCHDVKNPSPGLKRRGNR